MKQALTRHIKTLPDRLTPMGRQLHRRLPKTLAGRIQLGILATVTLAILIGVLVTMLLGSEPGYWKRNQKLLASDNATLLQLANTFEQRALRDLSGSPGQALPRRTVHVDFQEINAWLNIKLEDYLTNRGIKLPPQIHQPMLAGEEGMLILAFEYRTPRMSQIISVELHPIFQEDGQRFRLKLGRIRAGSIPLPLQSIRNQIASQSPQAAQQLDQILALLGDQWHEAIQRHPGDARLNLRLVGVDITPQGIDLQLQSEPRLLDNTSP